MDFDVLREHSRVITGVPFREIVWIADEVEVSPNLARLLEGQRSQPRDCPENHASGQDDGRPKDQNSAGKRERNHDRPSHGCQPPEGDSTSVRRFCGADVSSAAGRLRGVNETTTHGKPW